MNLIQHNAPTLALSIWAPYIPELHDLPSQIGYLDEARPGVVYAIFGTCCPRTGQCPPAGAAIPVMAARRLARGVFRLRATRTWPSMTMAEMPGMSPRAMAPKAS